MKKKFLALLLGATMVLSLVACGGSEEATETPEATAETESAEVEATEIEELTLMIQGSDYSDGIKAVVDYVNSKADELGATLVVETVPDGDQGEQLIQVRYAGGEDVPDILYFQPVNYANARMSVTDNFVDLTDNDYSAIYSDSYLRTPGYLLEDKLYSVPIATASGNFMFYNKNVLADAGITELPTTWEDFLAACDAVQANGITPVYYSAADVWTLQIIAGCGFSLDYEPEDSMAFAKLMETNQKKWIECPGFIDSLEKTKELVDKGYVQETYLSDTYQQGQQALLDGTCAFYPMGNYVIGEMEKIDAGKVDSDIGAFLVPLDPLYCRVSTNKGFYVSKNGKNAELAQAVMEAMVSTEGQQAYFNAQSGVPVATGVEVELSGPYADIKNIFDTAVLTTNWMEYCKYQKGPMETYIAEMLVETKTAEDVAVALDEDFAKAAKDANDPNWN